MERQDFEQKIKQIAGQREWAGMTVAVIVFTDGEHMLTQTWTIQTQAEYAECIDVHCLASSPPSRVPYHVIADVHDYDEWSARRRNDGASTAP